MCGAREHLAKRLDWSKSARAGTYRYFFHAIFETDWLLWNDMEWIMWGWEGKWEKVMGMKSVLIKRCVVWFLLSEMSSMTSWTFGERTVLGREVLALRHERRILGQWSNLVSGSRKSKPVLHGPNSTESNLFHHGETTYRVGWISLNPSTVLLSKNLWFWGVQKK